MTIDEIISSIEEKVKGLSKKELVKFWNWVFPEEEEITEKLLSSEIPGKTEELMEEISSMLIDEISCYDAKHLIKSYNKIYEEKITLEDLDRENEEKEEEEIDDEM